MKQYGSAIGNKKEEITSKKATVPFLVGSIIYRHEIFITEILYFKRNGFLSRAIANTLFIS